MGRVTTTPETSADNPQKLMLIDGHSLAFRSFYGTPVDVFVNAQGQHTNAVHGFLSTLMSLIKTERPSHIIVAFDLSGGTFRTEEYGEYKGGRNETPEEFYGQIELIQKALTALNIPSVTLPRYEADDIVATYARQGREAGFQVQIVSGDRDAFQLVTDTVTVLYPVTTGPTKGIRYMTPAAVEEKYKVAPHLYPDLAALTGEQADNLPGVPGVGPGFAAKWINEYGDLAGVLDNADKIKGKKGQALREHVEDVLRNRRLNRLVDDLDLPVTLADADHYGPNQEELDELFDYLEFNSIRKRMAELFESMLPAEPAIEISLKALDTVSTAQGLTDFLAQAPQNIAAVERGSQVPERLAQAVTLYPVIDREAPETSPAHGQGLHGLLLLAGHTAIYLDVPLADASLQAKLGDWLADSNAPKIVFDAKQAYKTLDAAGLPLAGVVEDPLLSSYVCGFIPTARRRGFQDMLEDLSRDYLNQTFPAEPEGADQGELFSLEPAVDLDYQGNVARYIQELAYALHRDLVAKNQLGLYQEIELPAASVLARMEIAGVALDAGNVTELKNYYGEHVTRATEAAYQVLGHEVNLSSPKQLQGVLFDELSLPTTRKLKSGYSTDADSLQGILNQVDPESQGAQFLAGLQTYRDYTKLKQTVEGLEKARAVDGRIHTSYQQNVAATGRLSSTDPNLQNIPIRTEEGRKIRDAFVVAPQAVDGVDYVSLLTADYSQIEMRIMVHLSNDEDLIQAYQDGEDLHRFVGAEVFGVAPEDVTPEMRSKVKAMSYGLAYGLSPFGLSKQLGISVDEATSLRSTYFQRFGRVGKFLRSIVKEAHKTGYTETMFGRRRILPDLQSSNRQRREAAERAALNSPIQGTAADIIKIAMINVDARLKHEGLSTRMLLQVHDELILEVASGEEEAAERILTEEMSGAASLQVPLDVQVGWGRSWHEAGH
ncbi:DNA polymerase I [Rothia sp. P5766]|uniref:DNA polymerase I n=1 Tax=Rothia sp. P5766 TaxID=3402656 RepID=UPI003AD9D3F4